MVLSEELARDAIFEEANIFGSWARRYDGESGRFPKDVDLVVVEPADPEKIFAACRRAEDRLGVEVNPVLLTKTEWKEAASPFLQSIKQGPLVRIEGGAGG
jgi:hypothetical protein